MQSPRMIRCWPSVAKLYEPHEICENRVTFVNVKSKYCIDEDFTVNYNLRAEFKSSTRDWIGIFPRNWLNLQQYLTFEYTLSSPPNAKDPRNRTITFPRIFHREAMLNLDYQLVYVSREIQIMATSCYFHFTPPPGKNELQHGPSKHGNPCPSIKATSSGTLGGIDRVIGVCADADPSMTTKDDNTTMTEGVVEEYGTNGLRPTCGFCRRQIRGLKIDALRGDFLASFSDSLLDRVRRLERDLSLAETHSKNANYSRDNISKRLEAYESFVAEMLNTVNARGIVQLTDEKGNEIVLQRVESENNSTSENGRKNDVLEKEIVSLKNTMRKQQKTINDMIEERNLHVQRSEPAKRIDREIQTNSSPECTVPLESSDNVVEKPAEGLEKLLPKIQKVKKNETSDTISTVPMNEGGTPKCTIEEKGAPSKPTTEPRVLRIQKPSGILVQGKNVKFAIIRL